MSLLSAPGSVLIKTFMKSLAEALWCTQIVFLSKQVLTIVAGGRRDALMIKVPGTYILLRWFSTTSNTLGAKRPLRMVSAFLGNYVSIIVVDLVQQKKLDSWNFYESNHGSLIWNYLIFYCSIRIMTVLMKCTITCFVFCDLACLWVRNVIHLLKVGDAYHKIITSSYSEYTS